MKGHVLTKEKIKKFREYLKNEEREYATIEKYIREMGAFHMWLEHRPVTKEIVVDWKESLQEKYAPVTVNAKISALNIFFRFMVWEECRVKFLRIQRQIFREQAKELTKVEYERLLYVARKAGKERLALLMETICATGIRVSEVPYITIEAVREKRAEVVLKGKIRVIFLPEKLCRKLRRYAKEQKIVSGEIFLTKSGKGLSRRQIWREMKALCKEAGVEQTKVFPHNLRHLFATSFYKICKDVVRLADVLGHSCVETTRIYLLTAGKEHARQLEQTGLVI